MSQRVAEWLRYTFSAVAGALVVVVGIALAFGEVRRDAADGAALAPRVGAIELRLAGDREWRNALDERLGRMETMLREALKPR